jgi:transcriptional regulator with XRE-family HTH domain
MFMPTCSAKQRVAIGKKIREGKDRLFPSRGGCTKLADELGISPQLLSHWMSGNRVPEPGQLVALAKLFNISILELCSLPKPKRMRKPLSAYDIIGDVTNTRKEVSKTGKNRRLLADRTSMLKTLIEKELYGN